MSAHRILVVDDHDTNRKLISELLQYEGHEVVQAGDAYEAEKLIRTAPPSLILMDVEMSGMDGLTLTRKLKADAATRDIPVVALTAHAMRGDEQKAREAGCDGYVTKPIDTRTLPALIAGLLRRAGPARGDRPSPPPEQTSS